jgi:hypothetical protein
LIDERPVPGASLDREIAHGEAVDAEIARFIERRAANPPSGEQEARWEDSERREDARREAQLRLEWSNYHSAQAARHKAVLASLIEHHEAEAEKYLVTPEKGTA